MATANHKSTDPFAWQPPANCVMTTSRVRAWWLRKRGYAFIGATERPYMGFFGGMHERIHYYFAQK